MKNFLFTLSMVAFASTLQAQVNNAPASDDAFDKKYRFGLRVTPQPTWYKSDNTVSKGAGSYFGFGFGLVVERKLSNIIRFSTGIGGDFEGGKISYRNDADIKVGTVLNNESEFVEAKNGIAGDEYDFKSGNTSYELKERTYKTTMVTIPLSLKMMTNEYSGFRYFANFGGEIGIRAGIKANDTYYRGVKVTTSGTTTATTAIADSDLKKENLIISKDASLLPFRLGMNLGLGTEYRIAGTTSLVFSVNYFQSFTNLMRNESKYLTKNKEYDTVNNKYSFTALNQNYIMRAVRINIGIMF
jgi:hypothetical protein